MTVNSPLPPRRPIAASHLPLTLMPLDEWVLVNITGADAAQYLQGQLTADVTALPEHTHTLCGHCDAKGKMWSCLRLFHYANGFAYLERRSVLETQLTELKKYAVFAKATITANNNVTLLGVAGSQASAALATCFSQLPCAKRSVIEHEGATLLYFSVPQERYLLIVTPALAEQISKKLESQAQVNDSQQWLSLEIEAGNPVIDKENSAQFIPQAVNLQALNGISFTKGCYTGQEMVARAKYRGANKRALYWLSGTASLIPQPGDELELKLGNNWRRTGNVLAAVKMSDDTVNIQAVLNNELESNSILRVHDDEKSTLAIQPLPYSLHEEK